MSKIVRLTETDLIRIVKRVISEEQSQSTTIGCRVPWDKLSKTFKSGYKLGDYPFLSFIENIPSQGATFGDKGGVTIDLEPDGTWTKWNEKNVGIENGKWSCTELPGGGVKINLN
jgi:hypothetical protein